MVVMLYSHHIINMYIYTYTCRIHIDAIIKTSEDFFKKYTSHFIERVVYERELETEQNCNILTSPLLWTSALSLSCSPGLLNWRPRGSLCWVLVFSTISCQQQVWSPKLTDFLSSPSYITVQSPTQYLPITGHRNVSLPASLEWHVWSSSSGNNCHAVHRSLSSGASVCDCTVGFYLVPYCQPSPSTWFPPITSHRNVSLPLSLEWHVWPVRRSIYNSDYVGK